MASRPKTSYETISPGPKYNFESTLLDRNKILSNLRKNLAIKMGQPSRKQSRMSYAQTSEQKVSVNNRTGLIALLQLMQGIYLIVAKRVLGGQGKRQRQGGSKDSGQLRLVRWLQGQVHSNNVLKQFSFFRLHLGSQEVI